MGYKDSSVVKAFTALAENHLKVLQTPACIPDLASCSGSYTHMHTQAKKAHTPKSTTTKKT